MPQQTPDPQTTFTDPRLCRTLFKKALLLLCALALPTGLTAEAPLVTVHAPDRVEAGDTVVIEVIPTADVSGDVLLTLGDSRYVLPQFIRPAAGGAASAEPGQTLSVAPPSDRQSSLYLWVQMQGPAVEAQWQGSTPRVEQASAQRGADGGLGGGGLGGTGSPEGQNATHSGTAGSPHTGGGGGGGGMEVRAPFTRYGGYEGGSGIVIVRYPLHAAQSSARGGVIRDTEGYRVHRFYEDGVFETNDSLDVEVLIVGGGGGGGSGPGGGGGAGGVIQTQITVPPGALPVTVGEGGAPGEEGQHSQLN